VADEAVVNKVHKNLVQQGSKNVKKVFKNKKMYLYRKNKLEKKEKQGGILGHSRF
jgi:hypothetical protein